MACESGAAILEFALVLPLLLVLIGGTVELGRAVQARLALESAVRAGARSLARVADPECRPRCSPAAEHALGLARERLVETSGYRPEEVSVGPDPGAPPGTVAVVGEIDLGARMPTLLSWKPVWRIRARHEEARVAG